MTTPNTTRPVRHYQRPPQVQWHLDNSHAEALHTQDYDYSDCAELLDSLVYDLFKIREKYHVLIDAHGPLYHVEVIDFVAKLDIVLKKAERDE